MSSPCYPYLMLFMCHRPRSDGISCALEQLDVAAAVQSSLKAYEEEEEVGSGSSSEEEGAAGGRKKRQKQRRNKTANFSSFRNKNFGFSLKQQRQIAESVVVTAAVDRAGGGGSEFSGLETKAKEGRH